MNCVQGSYRRIVVKIGTKLIVDSKVMHSLVEQIADQVKGGREIILVSSGAIACGMDILDLKSRPTKIGHLQAAASVGQSELMQRYIKRFSIHGMHCAQILLTWEDFDDRARFLNARNTITTILKWKSLPIINENDTVSIDEIRFGENDRLSALVANLIEADILIILSDVDGLVHPHTKDVVRVIDKMSTQIEQYVLPRREDLSSGGMKAKLSAAQVAMESQIPCLITNGKRKNCLKEAFNSPFSAGTLFLPAGAKIPSRKKWLVFCTRPKGRIRIDDGAKKAIYAGKSLLTVGVLEAEGNFRQGDIIEIVNKDGKCFARGKSNFSAHDLNNARGQKRMKEVVHRNDLIIKE